MTQIATVEKILPGGFVEISVPRKSACGHDCEECAGCGMTGAAIHARAKDPVGVRPGQKVVVESATRKILGVVALVYLLPVVGFLLGTNIGGLGTLVASLASLISFKQYIRTPGAKPLRYLGLFTAANVAMLIVLYIFAAICL